MKKPMRKTCTTSHTFDVKEGALLRGVLDAGSGDVYPNRLHVQLTTADAVDLAMELLRLVRPIGISRYGRIVSVTIPGRLTQDDDRKVKGVLPNGRLA